MAVDERTQAAPANVAIIVLNWNGWRDTVECLASLNEVEYPNLRVIVVDNGSADDSVERISNWCESSGVPCRVSDAPPAGSAGPWPPATVTERGIAHLLLIALRENAGFCAGNNIGMREAFATGADFALILNNDTVVTPFFLTPMVEAASRQEHVGLAGGVICYAEPQDTIWFAGVSVDRFLEFHLRLTGQRVQEAGLAGVMRTDAVTGCMMLVPRWTYEGLGGFDEHFFIWSEDWEYSLRVRASGYKLVVATESRIYHKVGHSLGVMKPLSYYYGTRNRLILKRMYLPWHLRTSFLTWFLISRAARYAQFALLGRWDLIDAGCAAIRDYFRGRTGKWRRHCN